MISYFKMKKKEIELKLMVYSCLLSLSDSSADELKEAFLEKIAQLAYEHTESH